MTLSKKTYYSLVIVFMLLIASHCFGQVSEKQLPEIWMTYYKGGDLDKDFQDMKAHGVEAVEVGIWGIEGTSRAKHVLKAARKHNLKLIIGIPEVAEQAFNFEREPERAVMMGGAFKGKAIDRFRFPFTPEKHSITIESPVYDSINCYGDIGRYFMGLTPVKAEVVVKQADFDGEQHLKIVDAKISPQKEHFWIMEFDLTGVEGDLENVVLAVYWISEGTRDYWIFGDAVSMFSEGFTRQLKKETRQVIDAWKAVNNGVFPSEIVAVRYGDECFHISGHMNSDACSYPMWDFSESAINHFQKTTGLEQPRGVGWTDMFGHKAYAQWMYNFHEAAAQSVKVVKSCFAEEGVADLPVFRNTTRMNIFDVMNDWDGSGQELLAKELDIIHYDPYPVNDKGYDETIIPIDMSYAEGLANRFNRPVIPWMQAHVYGHLQHPTPEHISKMVHQQKKIGVYGIMWLGYGYKNSGNTFPEKNPDSWKQAKKEHEKIKNYKKKIAQTDLAVIRPYTVRSNRTNNSNSIDFFLTDVLLNNAVLNIDLKYDIFEPLNCSFLDIEKLKNYNLLLTEIGIINKNTLGSLIESNVKTIVFANGAEIELSSLKLCGIDSIRNEKNEKIAFLDSKNIVLNKNSRILWKSANKPLAWQKGKLIFITELPDSESDFSEFVSNLFVSEIHGWEEK